MKLTYDERRQISEIKAQARKRQPKKPRSPKADRRERDPGFLAFLRRQPCSVGPVGCAGPVEAAHVRYADVRRRKPITGMQTKPDDRWCVSLCRRHHREGPESQHAGNEREFWSRHRIDALTLASSLYARYLAGGE